MSKNPVAQALYDELRQTYAPEERARMTLAVVQVGNDAPSTLYVKFKRRACERLGMRFRHVHYKDDTTRLSTLALCQAIEALNVDVTINGIIVQLPLPLHMNKYAILDAVSPKKDVDCFHIKNIARLYFGYEQARFVPATVYGIYRYLKHYNVETRGKLCVIVGKSNIVGKPLQLLLSDEEDMACTTVLCDKYTTNLQVLTAQADIVIVAAGKHHLLADASWLKEGAVVIDVGIHHTPQGVQGDVNYAAVKDKVSRITPVPGGVGPMTVASLVSNTAKAYRLQTEPHASQACTIA